MPYCFTSQSFIPIPALPPAVYKPEKRYEYNNNRIQCRYSFRLLEARPSHLNSNRATTSTMSRPRSRTSCAPDHLCRGAARRRPHTHRRQRWQSLAARAAHPGTTALCACSGRGISSGMLQRAAGGSLPDAVCIPSNTHTTFPTSSAGRCKPRMCVE